MKIEGISLYGSLLWLSFRNHLGNWRYVFSRILLFVFFTFVISEFWRAVIAQGGHNFPFDGNDIVWYCAVGQLIAFSSSRIFVRIEDDVLSGNLAYHLTRPVNYVGMRLAEGIGGLVGNLLLFLPVGFIFCLTDTGHLPKGSLPVTVIFIFFGSLLHMQFQILTGFSGVWLGEVQLPYRLYQKVMLLLGGLEIPIILYPLWAQALSWATPLGLLMARPCNAIFNPDRTEMWRGGILMSLWLFIIFVIIFGTYRRVYKHICINGG